MAFDKVIYRLVSALFISEQLIIDTYRKLFLAEEGLALWLHR
jgi:hypothetical protein